MVKPKLTAKQEMFAQQYVLTENATEAYKRAYNPKPGTKDKTIHDNAHKLKKSTGVAQRIEELKARIADKVIKKFDISIDGILNGISTVISDVQEIHDSCYEYGTKVKSKTVQLKAFDMIGKYAQLEPVKTSKHEIMGKGGEAIQLDVKNKDTNYDIARKLAFLLSAPQYQQLIKPTTEIKNEEHSNNEQQ